MKKINTYYIILVLCCFFACLNANAQIQHGGKPLSQLASYLNNEQVPIETMPPFDVQKMLQEDLELNVKGNPFRFGNEFEVNLSLQNSGLWQTLPNGDRIWRISIYSKGAHTMNFLFDDFFIPKGANLFIYNKNYQEVLGAFTHQNNKPYRRFSTTLIKGDKITFEYYEPKNVAGKGVIQFYKIIHAYRNYQDKASKGYGDSGACNINVACDVGQDWQDQINSVAMILNGNFRWCSGAMLNSVREDGTPYFLTADHCEPADINDVQYWNFIFNYQSPNCVNEDGPTNMSVSGANYLASNPNSDFLLLELSSPIPAEYNVFYNGWNNNNVPPQTSVGIHHPSGDIKKISFDQDNSVEAEVSVIGKPTHWRVDDWNEGTTEVGSSGSPLFDQNKLLVGQLHGGDAACGNDLYDVYGKFSESWGTTTIPNNPSSIAPWINPDNLPINTFQGAYGSQQLSQFDAAILLNQPFSTTFCEQFISLPNISIKNTGLENLTAAKITWTIDQQEPVELNWTGNLATFKTEAIELPLVVLNYGTHLLAVEIQQINNNTQLDANDNNNKILIPFEIIEGGEILEITVSTDSFAAETSFELLNTNNEMIVSGGGFQNSSTNTIAECLAPGCYKFTISDSYGDGMCCSFGQGSYSLNLSNSGVVAQGGEYEFNETTTFCVEATVGNTPQISALNISSNKVCVGSDVELEVQAQNYDSVLWSIEPPIVQPSTQENAIFNIAQAGTYTATVTLTNNFGVNEKQIVFEVFDSPQFTSQITPNTLANFEGAINIEATANSQILWQDGTTVFERSNLTEGTYQFTLIGEGECAIEGTVQVGVEYDLPIYPNPIAQDILNVYNPCASCTGKLVIFDIQGKEIGNWNIASGRNTINISNFQQGVYIVHYQYDNQKLLHKIVRL